jgi:hypothetical protein
MTPDMTTSIRASRIRVPRSRGAASGVLLVLLGAWAALIPMIGPSFNFAYTPRPNTSWHWTAARGWLEVLPGGVAFLGGLLLLLSTSRLITSFGGWLAAAAGAWLIVGPPLADVLNLNIGIPDPTSSEGVRALEALLFFYGVGAAILFLASIALGRLSVHSVRDVRAAEHRALAEQEAARAAEQQAMTDATAIHERRAAEGRQTLNCGEYADSGAGRHLEPGPNDQEPRYAAPPAEAGPADERTAAEGRPPVEASQQPYYPGGAPASYQGTPPTDGRG